MRRRRWTAEDAARLDREDAVRDAIDAAWEATTDAARAKLARKALKLDPDALDGYVILAQAIATEAESLALLFEAVRRGRRQWAAAIKRPSAHDFWLDTDTRPFMRAAHLLALLLWKMGEREEAAREAEALLRLNPNDNQGIRELLLAWYPAIGNWTGVAKLIKRYRDDWSVAHLYTKYLLALQLGEPGEAALGDALDANPHVPKFLADPDLPVKDDDNPLARLGYVSAGSEDEAAAYAEASRTGWLAVPGSVARLIDDARSLASS